LQKIPLCQRTIGKVRKSGEATVAFGDRSSSPEWFMLLRRIANL
jgi:hypothetical protein